MPVRRIEGQKTLLGRTMHAIHYNEDRDEIVVPQQFAQAVLTFRGAATGEEPPIRVIQGSRTQLKGSSGVVIDTVNNEIITEGLVFPLDANGNVAPIRTLPFNVLAVDPVNDLYVGSERGRGEGSPSIIIFPRLSESTKPLRVIRGPNTMLTATRRMRVYNDWIVVAHDGIQSDTPSGLSYVGIWSIYDDGDVPPRWTIGGPHKMLRKPRGVDLDPKNQTVIVSDKDLNAVLTYHVPEIFREAPGARKRNLEDNTTTARRGSAPGRFQAFWLHLGNWLVGGSPTWVHDD